MSNQTTTLKIKADSVWINRYFGYQVSVIAGANLDSVEYAPAIVVRTLAESSQILALDVGVFVDDFFEKSDTPANVIPIRG